MQSNIFWLSRNHRNRKHFLFIVLISIIIIPLTVFNYCQYSLSTRTSLACLLSKLKICISLCLFYFLGTYIFHIAHEQARPGALYIFNKDIVFLVISLFTPSPDPLKWRMIESNNQDLFLHTLFTIMPERNCLFLLYLSYFSTNFSNFHTGFGGLEHYSTANIDTSYLFLVTYSSLVVVCQNIHHTMCRCSSTQVFSIINMFSSCNVILQLCIITVNLSIRFVLLFSRLTRLPYIYLRACIPYTSLAEHKFSHWLV